MTLKSLTLIGSGIKYLSHLTTEAYAYIQSSDKLLYLVNEPALKSWLNYANCSSESLECWYNYSNSRLECYKKITEYILSNVNQYRNTCVLIYGHPTIFAKPGLDAIVEARKKGFDCRVLPGISAMDCLFADLLIDPGSCGCQIFEATDLLIYDRKIDISCHLIIWQIDVIGKSDNPSDLNSHGVEILTSHLAKHYELSSPVILYEAAQYPHFHPKVQKSTLKNLPYISITPITTLYIPPQHLGVPNNKILKELNLIHANS